MESPAVTVTKPFVSGPPLPCTRRWPHASPELGTNWGAALPTQDSRPWGLRGGRPPDGPGLRSYGVQGWG